MMGSTLAVAMLFACGGTRDPAAQMPRGMLLASDLDLVWIDADATHVFFTTADHRIGRIPVGGGAPTFLAHVPVPSTVAAFTLDNDHVYLALEEHRVDARGDLAGTLRIASVAKSAENVTPRILAELSGIDLDGIAVDREAVYFGVWLDERAHEIRSVPKRDGPSRVVLRSDATADEVLAHATFDRPTDRGSLVAVDDAHVYWLTHGGHDVSLTTINKGTGGRVARSTSRGTQPHGLHLGRATTITLHDDHLRERSKLPGGQDGLSSDGLAHPRIAVDDDLVVLSAWLTPMPTGSKRIVVAFDGTRRQHVVADSDATGISPIEVAVSAGGIFVVDEGPSVDKLWRFDRPQ